VIPRVKFSDGTCRCFFLTTVLAEATIIRPVSFLLTSVRLSFNMRWKVLAGSGAGEPLLTGF